jgi:hypothetical protein
MLRPDPAQASRLTEIINNLTARLTEAHHQGWLGEVEGIETSLDAARNKLTAMQRTTRPHPITVELTPRPRRHPEQEPT